MTNSAVTFSAIYDKYAGALYGSIVRKIGNEEKANLAFEKAFAIIFRNYHQYSPQHSTLFTWMMAIVQKEIMTAK
jgi:hypothetical protein